MAEAPMDTDSVNPVTFSSLYDKMLKGKERRGLRPSTMNGYRDNERSFASSWSI